MKLVIQLELDNSAFENFGAFEVGNVLGTIADRLPEPLAKMGEIALMDSNGNWVGYATIVGGEISDSRSVPKRKVKS